MNTPRALQLIIATAGASFGAGCGLELSGGANLEQESVFSIWSPPTPAEAARWAADPYDPDKRQKGMLLLANAPWGGDPVYVRFYESALNDADGGVRATACIALGRHGSPEHARLIAERLQDSDPAVRREAAHALQRVHNPAVVRDLMRAADTRYESDSETRAAAATALGQYPDPQVVQTLIGSLRDQRLLVNQAALDSLVVLTGQDFGFDVRAWVQWTSQTADLFAGRGSYVYPVYQRNPKLWELFVPWMQPPNETASMPVGLIRQPTSDPTEGG